MEKKKTSRNTKQKQVVIEFLKKQNEHVTAEDVILNLRNGNIPVGKATVYRILKQLEENGRVKRYHLTDGARACYRYIREDSTCNEHSHLMCRDCGGVVHFKSEPLMQVTRNLERSEGFVIDDRKTVFYGKCKMCAGN